MQGKLLSTYRIIAYVLLILGILHCAMVPVFYETLSHDAIFSLGTGLAVIFLGLLNITAARLLVVQLLTIAIIANVIQVAYSGFALLVLSDPQAYIGLFIFLIGLALSWMVRREAIETSGS